MSEQTTMKAIVKTRNEYGNLSVENVPIPQVKPGYVLIKVHACGICGSDVNIYKSANSYSCIPIPIILGHEYAGEIIQTGEGVINWQIGDRVLGEAIIPCDSCSYCRKGQWHLCSNREILGINRNGSMAEYISVPTNILHQLPAGLDYNIAVVAQPCAVAMHAIDRSCFGKGGEYIAVFGPGIIGITASLIAKIRGAECVVLFGTDDDDKERLPLARKIGIEAINLGRVEHYSHFIKKVAEVNDGFDLALECSGAAAAFTEAANCLKAGGTLVEVGITNEEVTLDMAALVRREVRILTSYSACWLDYERSLKIISHYSSQIKKIFNVYSLSEAITGIDCSSKKKILKGIISCV